jgi:adenylate cyclase class 2
MPVNLELKIRVTSHTKLKILLSKIKAERKGILNQEDIYYRVKDGLLKLRTENGNETLIYYRREEKKSNRWSDYYLLKLKNGEGKRLFNRIFESEVIVKKKRELFYYDNTRIHLDTVKYLGKFLELETLVINGKANAKKRFTKIINLLELDNSKEIRRSFNKIEN